MLAEVESISSCPEIAFNKIAASSTSFVIGPIWSREDANAISPYRDTLPYVGFSPTTPQMPAGCLMDPPVSDPSANIASSPATAAADPPDEPPGILSGSHGFLVGP